MSELEGKDAVRQDLEEEMIAQALGLKNQIPVAHQPVVMLNGDLLDTMKPETRAALQSLALSVLNELTDRMIRNAFRRDLNVTNERSRSHE